MTITTTLKTTKYFEKKEGEEKKEPEVKEKVLTEFKTTSEVATAMLELLNSKDSYPIFNKDGDMEFSQYMDNEGKIEKELIIKFSK